ncbi:cchain crystal structure of crm1 inhibitorleptomycin b in complex with crm1()-ran-ranbp1 [Lichtheimia corymbifera JMRC:FSU:9682]|uniref:Cchain crystal structure of crm1 inhibitorleptomycin b in complex with crm1( )-ran-ranbp1 n=1 Tax=Lichtheimia corymbifera JMRC:FSU:9682 TaxID=1263082 RepID=A0A068SC87_9FUNG|nr:cchain crystal structure of crm1 inhibitorleptomycin b in complex with crm1()-ran-ranbp1 [Lichtheimia corymbifera JMRC:FSU:9682]
MESLVNSRGECNVVLLDQLVHDMLQGDATMTKEAQAVLYTFQQWPDAWQVTDQILDRSHSMHTKFIALNILERFVAKHWKQLDVTQRIGVRNYLIQFIVAHASDNASLRNTKPLLNKLDGVLVQIVKKEWPEEWPTFLDELVLSSSSVFDVSAERQPRWKQDQLAKHMTEKFAPIMTLCNDILAKNTPTTLTNAALESLQRFLTWVPAEMVFNLSHGESQSKDSLIYSLCLRLAMDQCSATCTLILQCLIEAMNRKDFNNHQPASIPFLGCVINAVRQRGLFPSVYGMGRAQAEYASEDVIDQLVYYTRFLTTALSVQQKMMMDTHCLTHQEALEDLVQLFGIDDDRIRDPCIEYWAQLTHSVLHSTQAPQLFPYAPIIEKLRRIVPLQIKCPDNTIVVHSDDDGVADTAFSFISESETEVQYKASKHLLENLTQLDAKGMETAFREMWMEHTQDSKMPSWLLLSKLCWATSAISDALPNTQFVADCFLQLESIATRTTATNLQNAITAYRLYLAGHSVRLLNERPEFLQHILALVCTCVHSQEPYLREMACSTFSLLCNGSKHTLVLADGNGVYALLDELDSLVTSLEPRQVHGIYGAVATVISASPELSQQQQIPVLMHMPNKILHSLVKQPQPWHQGTWDMLDTIVQINVHVCTELQRSYTCQLQAIGPCLVSLYRELAQTEGNLLLPTKWKTVKEHVKELTKCYVGFFKGDEGNDSWVTTVYPLLEVLALSPPEETDMGDLLGALISSSFVQRLNTTERQGIFLQAAYHQVFERVYEDIRHDFTSKYAKRFGFFQLVDSFIRHAFEEMMALLKENEFSLLVESILWGIQHPAHEISNKALETCNVFLDRIAELEEEDSQNTMYKMYYTSILHAVLCGVLDHDRRTQFDLQSQLLARLLDLVQQGEVYTQLYQLGAFTSNAGYVEECIRQILREIYPTLPQEQIDMVAQGMVGCCDDIAKFRQDLIDFMADFRSSDEFAQGTEALEAEAWERLTMT